jgi:hypothetical protein
MHCKPVLRSAREDVAPTELPRYLEADISIEIPLLRSLLPSKFPSGRLIEKSNYPVGCAGTTSPFRIPCDSHHTAVYSSAKLASIYLTFLRKCGLILAYGIGSVMCLGIASVVAGLLYGETSTPRAFFLLFLILTFMFGGFYLFIRCLKIISPNRRIRVYPSKRL